MENVPYNDAVYIIKNHIVNKSHYFSNIVSNNAKQTTVASNSLNTYDDSFPVFNPLPNKNNAYIKHKKKNYNNSTHPPRFSSSGLNNNNIPDWSALNGFFLKYMAENVYSQPADKSGITNFAEQLK